MLKHRIVRLILGWIAFGLGLLGLILPILQGWLFLAIAIILLAPDVPFFNRILQWFRKKYPQVADKADRMTGNRRDSQRRDPGKS